MNHYTRVTFTTSCTDIEDNGASAEVCYEFVEGNSTDFVLHVIRFMRATGYVDEVIASGFNEAAEELGWLKRNTDDPADAD